MSWGKRIFLALLTGLVTLLILDDVAIHRLEQRIATLERHINPPVKLEKK